MFSPNSAGLTASDLRCRRYGKIGILTGTFTPNQAGTPLILGSINTKLVTTINFPITCYEKVASYGILNPDGLFQCNIPTAMANNTCVINIAFIIE